VGAHRIEQCAVGEGVEADDPAARGGAQHRDMAAVDKLPEPALGNPELGRDIGEGAGGVRHRG